MVYAPLANLPYWDRKFDIVIAGALLEHLADPVSVIGALAGLAREAVIIAFTPVTNSPGTFMETSNDWTAPEHDFTFWHLSAGLYHRIFENLGFTLEIAPANARLNGHDHTRSTLIARRRSCVELKLAATKSGNTENADRGSYLYDPQPPIWEQLNALKEELTAIKEERDIALEQRDKALIEKDNLRLEVAALHGSASWVLTSPLRALSSSFRTSRSLLSPNR